MKWTMYRMLLVAVAIATFTSSCQKELSCEGCAGGNLPPVAVAGADQFINLPGSSALLDGSLSTDADGRIMEWHWTKIAGPASCNMLHPDSVKTAVANLVQGIYQFELSVKDDKGAIGKDTVQIQLGTTTSGNRPPVACAGPDQMIGMSVNQVLLNGNCSSDPDNNITSYQWTKISGPSSFSLATANAVQTQALNLVIGTYQFELKVTDAGGLFAMDTVSVSVHNVLVDVYIAGAENGKAKYWKNGQPVSLASAGESVATSITVTGNDVYVAGFELQVGTNQSRAKYWKNGQEVFLTTGTSAMASSIAVVGSDVYVAGREDGVAKYWKNGQSVALTNGSWDAYANAIAVVGSDVYVAGTEFELNAPTTAKYWKNGQAFPLPNGTVATAITIAGNDVYVAGSGLATEAKYWKNGQSVTLSNSSNSKANSINVAGGDVYAAGYHLWEAGYWKNGQLVALSNGNIQAEATSITTLGGDVYIAGNISNLNNPAEAIYWKNGQPILLTNGMYAAYAYSICVVQR